MTTFAFRINCLLSGDHIETMEPSIAVALPAPGPELKVLLQEVHERTAARSLILWSGGFASEDEARTAGAPVQRAVMLAGLMLGVGIDVGTDQVVSPAARRKDGEPDAHLQPDVHGLQIVPQLKGEMLFGFLRVDRPLKRIPPGDFAKKVTECYAFDRPLTKKQVLAAQLYNQSHFYSSDAGRFLTLISAVEALVEQTSKSDAAVALVESMIEVARAKDDLSEPERESLCNGLRELRRQSISASCRKLVHTHCGETAEEDFGRAYKIRSTMLHRGEPPPGIDLMTECLGLDGIVRRLVVAHLSD